ncbi:DegT/DnrJ/EryC1/StrS family aminotransferase [Larkinella terrae]|uniref:GDP-perosamine synthase n=1 Tax=Larkinella terrae TaxID=2025311 RepID=A0A7K0EHL4_9BACT|nr:aminotransferase class I/II-fold pyridoxal phosphate-dependent enzyme [Larkinella terrae]MRS60946.1 aminotransferase class I/II-fold pyridoxal phosphate-dependent enzyme [Larkinella terrae]
MNPDIYLSSPHLGELELRYVQEAFATNWIAPLGPHVDAFEQEICAATGVGHAAALSSGTAALHLALVLLGVGPGDEVLCQSFTFAASANPIRYQGAQPIYVDSEMTTWNMCPDALETALQDRIRKGKRPKAVIAVNLYGMPARFDAILAICQRYEVPLIEDAAESFGSTYKNVPTGRFGTVAVLSFNGNKIITTSGGGALLSEDDKLIAKARFLATQARDPAPHYQHSSVGYNYRMSNVCAGIGRGQLAVLATRVAQRRANFNYYVQELSQLPGLNFQPEPADCFSNRWLTCITIDPALSDGLTREAIRLALAEQRIEARPLWKPMHRQPVFAGSPYYGSGIADQLFENGLCLPSGSNLTQEQRDKVVSCIRKTAAAFSKR